MSTYFPDQPDLRPVIGGYKLREEFIYCKGEHLIRVPKDYLCDGASVPRIVWTFSGLTPDGLIRAAALIHDYLYEKKGIIPTNSTISNTKYSKRDCDILFKEIMQESGVPWFATQKAFYAVKVFGWTYWARNKYPIVFNE